MHTESTPGSGTEKQFESNVGQIRCFDFQDEGNFVGYWCVTSDAAVSMRYQGERGRINDFWAIVRGISRGVP
jgi:hypothetical protein